MAKTGRSWKRFGSTWRWRYHSAHQGPIRILEYRKAHRGKWIDTDEVQVRRRGKWVSK